MPQHTNPAAEKSAQATRGRVATPSACYQDGGRETDLRIVTSWRHQTSSARPRASQYRARDGIIEKR